MTSTGQLIEARKKALVHIRGAPGLKQLKVTGLFHVSVGLWQTPAMHTKRMLTCDCVVFLED